MGVVCANHTTQSLIFFVLERVARGRSRWRATVCCRVVYVVCVVAKKTIVAGGECERTRHNALAWIRLSVGGRSLRCRFSCVGLNRFAILTVDDQQSRHWRRGDCVRPSRSVVVVARARVWRRRPFLFCFLFLVFLCPAFPAARSCCGALLMACAPCSALCARLDAVCARCCVQLALYSVCFVSHSETRMHFFAVQIAAYSCWLVAVSAQLAISAADAEALNQTLTGLGCWQSSTCQSKNFNCNSGVVVCNANGSVASL